MCEDLKQFIREIPDFPRQGIRFKDIGPLLHNGEAFGRTIDELARICEENDLQPEICACPEARGFIFGGALAFRLGIGFVPIRKPGKLPSDTARVEYALEYGKDSIEMHLDAVKKGQKVLLVDDLLATGGTLGACADLIRKSEAEVVGVLFVVELTFLEGRKRLSDYPTFSIIRY
ncbi:MAG: adenine phosphoribosyltransferase [Planctomycetota bacterium]|nr:adenine phosphoribosyltransferase [Planctomycetota bacterium]